MTNWIDEQQAAMSDPEGCQSCGRPFAAPECDECFEARWQLAPVTALHALSTATLNQQAA